MAAAKKPTGGGNGATLRRRAKARAEAAEARRALALGKRENDETAEALAALLPPTPARTSAQGANTHYDPEIAADMCKRMALGETLSAICARPGFPTATAFRGWTLAYPELRDAWIAARRIKATSLFDEALDLARDLKQGRKLVSSTEVNALRVAIDTLRWAASKLDPGQYGDQAGKVPVVAIQINSNLDLGRNATVSGDDSLYSFTVQLPPPLDPSTGAEQQRVPVSKRKAGGGGNAGSEGADGER